MKKAAKTRSHTYLHTYTQIHSNTYTHTIAALLCAILIGAPLAVYLRFSFATIHCRLPACHLSLATCHYYLTPPLLLLPLFPLLLAALPFRCLFAYCAKISLEPTICSLLFFRSGCSPRGRGGARCRQMRHATPLHIYLLYMHYMALRLTQLELDTRCLYDRISWQFDESF